MKHESSSEANRSDLRLVRCLLPAYLVREIDEIVLKGQSAYETREEFIRDAIQNHVLEVTHGEAEAQLLLLPDRVARSAQRTRSSSASPRSGAARAKTTDPQGGGQVTGLPVALSGFETVPIDDLDETRIGLTERGAVLEAGIARVREEPMFGLHNRDYPSVWAAQLLAKLTPDSPVVVQEFLTAATREAWRYGQRLLPLEKELRVKLTALFPTNTAKAQAAEGAFSSFAIGDIARRPNEDGTLTASGPLFLWRVCELAHEDGRLLIGLTPQGYDLLDELAGLTLHTPHSREHAERFTGFLRACAPADWSGFAFLLNAVRERPNRQELTHQFQSWHPEWGASKANTNAAGYVARAREWGLIEPKLVSGKYELTGFGDEIRAKGFDDEGRVGSF